MIWNLLGNIQIAMIFIGIGGVCLSTTSCQGGIDSTSTITIQSNSVNSLSVNEVILFCGNPGAGKSSLCNSVFQEPKFKSGFRIGNCLTTEQQEYIYEGVKYIDTPGLSEVDSRDKAAAEIEKALKDNNNYKIIFVITVESGRIKYNDLVTINTVCDAIKTDFEYGIINKITNNAKRAIEEAGGLEPFLKPLHRRPASILFIKFEGDMNDEENVYLSSNSESRANLADFITRLPASKISADNVEPIDYRNYEERVGEMIKQVKAAREAASRAQEEIGNVRNEIAELNRILHADLRYRDIEREQEELQRRLSYRPSSNGGCQGHGHCVWCGKRCDKTPNSYQGPPKHIRCACRICIHSGID